MAVRIIKPARQLLPPAPEIPFEVAMMLQSEIGRHDLAIQGSDTIPDAEEIVKSLERELDLMDKVLCGRVTERVEKTCYNASAAWMIWRGIWIHGFTAPDDIPTAPDARRQHALTGMTYAALIETGIDLTEWSETWRDYPRGGAWPSDAHAVCAAVGRFASAGIGGDEQALDFAADMRDDATAMLNTVAVGD